VGTDCFRLFRNDQNVDAPTYGGAFGLESFVGVVMALYAWQGRNSLCLDYCTTRFSVFGTVFDKFQLMPLNHLRRRPYLLGERANHDPEAQVNFGIQI
jgi:hypothetical protein